MSQALDSGLEITVTDEDGTSAVAQAVAGVLRAGDVVALTGTLGAGKTFFVRSLARALGVPPEIPVRSPSFVLALVYEGRLPIFHLDLYRLTDEDELEAIGWRDWLDAGALCLVEWADRVPGALPAVRLDVHLEPTGVEERRITLGARGWPAARVVELRSAVSLAPTGTPL